MEERQMFDPPRYATRGIMDTIPAEVQFTLWAMIDIMRQHSGVSKIDYLQVFTLSPQHAPLSGLNQAIHHHQEIPPYVASNAMSVDEPVTAKIFVIDDGLYATMLLASEY